MCIMDNGNDPPARIPFWEFLMKNMIPKNSGLTEDSDNGDSDNQGSTVLLYSTINNMSPDGKAFNYMN